MVNAEKVFPFIEKKFGTYPYKQFSFVAGGDGGMEYPMATLLAGPGAWLHELMHNWYYGILASNENRYSWMDEGFTSYADNLAKAFLTNKPDSVQTPEYTNYFNVVKSGLEEPLNTPSDFFNTNLAYSMASYSKGAMFLEQLGYIVGKR
ncbi:MAG TPA: M1 family aminopeptidase [Niabella sp.]|nr:M1 family aminopeptidase [Niabella sp.]